MGVGVSLFMIAVGAILTWAVDATVSGVDLNAIGWILMIVGVVGLALSIIFWNSLGFGRSNGTTVVNNRNRDL